MKITRSNLIANLLAAKPEATVDWRGVSGAERGANVTVYRVPGFALFVTDPRVEIIDDPTPEQPVTDVATAPVPSPEEPAVADDQPSAVESATQQEGSIQ